MIAPGAIIGIVKAINVICKSKSLGNVMDLKSKVSGKPPNESSKAVKSWTVNGYNRLVKEFAEKPLYVDLRRFDSRPVSRIGGSTYLAYKLVRADELSILKLYQHLIRLEGSRKFIKALDRSYALGYEESGLRRGSVSKGVGIIERLTPNFHHYYNDVAWGAAWSYAVDVFRATESSSKLSEADYETITGPWTKHIGAL